ncbi:ABC transporter substrate-binding protein [Niveibacterium sp. 24ML]|uniref:ABC transporter substrate-binding protein n=1 Tax=Niveibacterium sp. 24ML TaxID=2985512 RepID=UPI00226D7EA6|nr:ABC transporter substrate-binding protein [Niveibacterium sp. 24ML]MCX9155501.1 ABC transporter substrate-binding protein [Niveibacterium sp. 24ML]
MKARWPILLMMLAIWLQPVQAAQPFRIYAVTYRGATEVERGFADYFAARGIPVEITYRDIALDTSRLPALVEEIRRTRPDLVYTWGSGVTLGIAGPWDQADPARYITDIPVVFSLVAAPVSARIVPAMQSSRRNVTGVSHLASVAAQMQVMAAYRAFGCVGVLYSPNEPNALAVLDDLRAEGRRRGFRVEARAFRTDAAGKPVAAGAEALVGELRQAGAQWLYLPPDSFLNTQARAVVLPAALKAGLPSFASTEPLMAAGALAGLVSRYYTVGQFAGYKAEQILLNKRPPSQIPVETLTRFSLQVSLPVARQLGALPPLAMFNYAEMLEADFVAPTLSARENR